MRSFAILGRQCASLHAPDLPRGRVTIEGVTVTCGLVVKDPPAFDPDRQRNAVWIRVLAFSLNFRDRTLILRMSTSPQRNGYYVIGSELVAEVLAVGADVSDLAPGDHVIPDGCWPAEMPGAHAGPPTNHAWRRSRCCPERS